MEFDWYFDDAAFDGSEEEDKADGGSEGIGGIEDEERASRKHGAKGADSDSRGRSQQKGDRRQRGKGQKPAPDRIAELESRIQELERKCDELSKERDDAFNRMLLIKADSENYRKRLDKDKEETVRLANKGLVVDLLPSLDSMDVALSAIADEAIRKGVEMVRSSLLSSLGKWGLEIISPVGKEFDPTECEACLFEEKDDVSKEIVIEVLQAGYFLHGKVVRPAKVKIAKPAGGSE